MWRSPVAHFNGVEVVGGSNPLTPTDEKARSIFTNELPAFLSAITHKALRNKTQEGEQNGEQNQLSLLFVLCFQSEFQQLLLPYDINQ